jgi:hypothetical protein
MDRIQTVTQREVIRGVRDRWLEQYKHYPDENRVGMGDRLRSVGSIRKALAALDLETCSVSDIDAAIGTTGWADNECDLCHQSQTLVIRLGDEPDYEARWVDVCPNCLAAAQEVARTPQVNEVPHD